MNEGNRVPPGRGLEGAAAVAAAEASESVVPEGVLADETAPGTEPDRPVIGPERGADTGAPGGAAGDAEGDFELAKPVASPVPAPREGEREDGDGPGVVGGPGRAAAQAAGSAPWAASAERPTPLHAPDPYSTPPYGEPGPWAPAPPVQHPTVTPVQRAAVPQTATPSAPAPAPGSPVPVPVVRPPAPAPRVASASVPAASAPPAEAPAPASAVATPESSGAVAAPWGRYGPWGAGSPEEEALAHAPGQQTAAAMSTYGQHAGRAKRRLLGWALVIALVSAGIGGVAGAYVERDGLGGGVHLPQAGGVPAGRAPDSVAGIAARALPSVVTLHVTGADEAGTGTGFVLDTEGHILTNNHVVESAGSDGEVSVTFSSGDLAKAKVVGRDSGYDLAVVQVHGVHGLTPLPLGNSDDVRVGDPVVAIGAPFDLANTVTAGIISAKERPLTSGGTKGDGSDVSYVDALQTDAAINPGNSGGPLLDSRAEVIGINSAIRSAAGASDLDGSQSGSIGLGFAIPINQAKRVAEELINHGHATHPVMGVTLDMGYPGDGARIDDASVSGGPAVVKGGPGERAGLRAGEVITEVDGGRVHTGAELIVKVRAHRPGDRLRLTVRRDGIDREVLLVLGASAQN
ncbi:MULTISPECIES: S1C family serine protease [unclassified Streptomyces]|uniref:S1C family serine protease n=1 Tax=unclassified Streptomyces TaxID=2593676 RepID=UPI00099D6243|nr:MULTISPECIES: trypsin-like peptidase domain-containing protein [unclassified Streptomyces]MCH0556037.1 trypsin-like peptidase domain-containing protein [Streptomyces sp. MUM 16J]